MKSLIKKNKSHIKTSWDDKIFYGVSNLFVIVALVFVAYPIIYVISCSFSSAAALSTGKVLLWPVDATLAGYEFVLHYKQVWIGYRNTILYTIFGVSFTMFMQIVLAYPISKAKFQGRKFVTGLYMFTMMFGAGMIPSYIVKASLGLVGKPIAVVISGAIGVSNVLILRTAFNSVPKDLYEAAEMDGASEIRSLITIAIPLSKATISVLILYSIAGNWNEYFTSMLYLRNENHYPLQLVLRTILTGAEMVDLTNVSNTQMLQVAAEGTQQIKYALIVVATAPMLLFYSIVQKYLKGGIMIGAVKG